MVSDSVETNYLDVLGADDTQLDNSIYDETQIIEHDDITRLVDGDADQINEEEEEEYDADDAFNNEKSFGLSDDSSPAGIFGLLPPISVLAGTAEVSSTAYCLGIFLGTCLSISCYLLLQLISMFSSGFEYPFLDYLSIVFNRIFSLLNPIVIPWQLPVYGISFSLFHFLEYYTTAVYNPNKVSPTSFLLRNGAMYIFAHSLAVSEALIERYFCGFLPSYIRLTLPVTTEAANVSLDMSNKNTIIMTCISFFGLVLLVCGQSLRSSAMIHAAANFSHTVVRVRDRTHKLVTTGVYAFSRHPSYSGFFLWALGTQLLLVNPLSFCVFWVLLWKFFKDRIEDEEELLIKFFGNDYIEYKKSVPVRIPFI